MTVETAKLTWNTGKITNIQKKCNEGILQMGFDISSDARRNAPVLTGALRNSIRTTTRGTSVYVLAGSARVPYAKLREYVNHKHPQTTHYMGRAFDKMVASDWKNKYFGDLA